MVEKNGKKRIAFKLQAPAAKEVFLVGSFDAWEVGRRSMKQDREGIWKATVSLEPGVYEYRFMVDGEWWDDPCSTDRCGNAFGTQNCVVRV